MATYKAEIQSIIDLNFAGDADIFAAAAESFLASLEPAIEEYRSAILGRDCVRIRAAAHRLSGDVSLFHRPEVARAFSAIEDSAKLGVATKIQLSDDAERALLGLKSELETALREISRD